jgi:hypothetical protein
MRTGLPGLSFASYATVLFMLALVFHNMMRGWQLTILSKQLGHLKDTCNWQAWHRPHLRRCQSLLGGKGWIGRGLTCNTTFLVVRSAINFLGRDVSQRKDMKQY